MEGVLKEKARERAADGVAAGDGVAAEKAREGGASRDLKRDPAAVSGGLGDRDAVSGVVEAPAAAGGAVSAAEEAAAHDKRHGGAVWEGTTMPRGDGTGPTGMGPMTGRAAGICAGFGVPGYMNPTPERGGGRWGRRGGGRGGGGRGWRHQYFATGVPGWARTGKAVKPGIAPETEREMLEHQLEFLQAQIGEIRKRLEAIAAAETAGKTS